MEKQGIDLSKQMPESEIVSRNKQITINKLNTYRKSKGLPPQNTFRATGGAIMGWEEDDDGSLRYNVGKGVAAAIFTGAGIKLLNPIKVKRGVDAISKYPALDKIAGTVGKEKSAFSLSGLWGRFNKLFFDRFSPIEKITPETYREASFYSAHKDLVGEKFKELKGVFSKVNRDEYVVTNYINAHRQLTRAERGIPNPDGVTLKEAKQAIQEAESLFKSQGKNVEDLRGALKGFNDWTTKYIIEDAVDSGMLSMESAVNILEKNKFYATFDVLDHMAPDIKNIRAFPSGEYFSVGKGIFNKMTGTKKKIADPVESTIKKFMQAQNTFARNKVANTFIDEATELVRPVASSEKEFLSMRQLDLDPVMQGRWNKRKFDTITRFKDGKPQTFVTDKVYADTMKQLTPKQVNRLVGVSSDVFRKTATSFYLPFTISNAMRDAFMGYTTSKAYTATTPHKFAHDWAKGFREGLKHEFLGESDVASKYIKSGGGFGFVGTIRKGGALKRQVLKPQLKGSPKEIAKTISRAGLDVVTSPFKLIEKTSAAIELAPRLANFSRSIKQGKSASDAAMIARRSTIDFNRGGTFTKVANQWVPFLNARVQGRVTLATALKNDTSNTLKKAFVSTVIPGATTYAWNRVHYSELYDDIPSYVKDKYFPIIYGSEVDEKGRTVPNYFVIAKGDLGEMTWNPIEYRLDQQYKENPGGGKAFLVNFLSDLSPIQFAREGKPSLSKTLGGVTPPIFKGVVEDATNTNLFTGREIEPKYMKDTKPPELRFRERTPETYKWLSKKLNGAVSPLRLQNFASTILAGYGREGLDPQAMFRGLSGRVVRSQGGAKEQQAWDIINDIEKGYKTTRAYAVELVRNGEIAPAIKLLDEWNSGVGKQIAETAKLGFKDKGGLRKKFLFTTQKRKNLLRNRQDDRSAIERKISRR